VTTTFFVHRPAEAAAAAGRAPHQFGEHLGRLGALGQAVPVPTVVGNDSIGWPERPARADGRRLLPDRQVDEAGHYAVGVQSPAGGLRRQPRDPQPRRTERGQVLKLRAGYETCFRRLVQAGAAAGVFTVTSVRVASYAILDLGMGVSAWYRETGEYSEDALVWQYSEFALRLVGARP
jgi:hypothetical protein